MGRKNRLCLDLHLHQNIDTPFIPLDLPRERLCHRNACCDGICGCVGHRGRTGLDIFMYPCEWLLGRQYPIDLREFDTILCLDYDYQHPRRCPHPRPTNATRLETTDEH